MTAVKSATRRIDSSGVLGLPGLQLRLAKLGDLDQKVDAAEQDVHMLRPEDQLAFLGRDEAVFHRVGDPHGGIETDDPAAPLSEWAARISGLDHFGRRPTSLERHQARRQRGGVALRLHAEELHHRESTQVAAQCPRLRNAAKTRCSSSKPMLRSFQDKTA